MKCPICGSTDFKVPETYVLRCPPFFQHFCKEADKYVTTTGGAVYTVGDLPPCVVSRWPTGSYVTPIRKKAAPIIRLWPRTEYAAPPMKGA